MTGFGFSILVCLSCTLFQCEGVIYFPAEGEEYVFLPGSTGNITWKFDDDISSLTLRAWFFTRSGGSPERLVTIADDDRRKIRRSSLTGVEIEKPATLLLKNVNQSYNGEYQFAVTKSNPTPETIGVQVFIAKKPTVTLNCSYSSPIVLNEGDDFICVCRGVDGNPPADVTWFNGSVEIGETKKENNTLTLRNVYRTANGTYKCEARSHTNDSYKDEKTVKLRVRTNSKPIIKSFASDPVQPINDKPVTLTCESDGVPEPDYVIKFKNGTNASTQKTYHISKMGSIYAGIYTCIAENIKGNDSATLNLTGHQETKMTNSPTTKSVGTGKANIEECKCTGGTEWYIVMVSLLSGLIIGILLSYIVSCFRRKFRSRSTQSNPESKTPEVDPTYQELDLTKMNKEDNYQSLRVNVASNVATNEDNSTYTELNQARDVENNYQSLT